MAALSYTVNVIINNQRRLDDLANSAAKADLALKAVQDRAAQMDAALTGQMGAVNELAGAYRDLRTAAGEAAAAQKLAAGASLLAAGNTDRARASTGRWVVGLGFGLTALKLLHLGVMAFGAQIAADTIGLAAFGIAAANAFGPIVSNWSTLTTTFGQLDPLQKAAVINIQNLGAALDKVSHETGVFVVFNEGLTVLRSLMHGAGQVTIEAEQAFEKFAAQLNTTLNSPGWKALLTGTGSLVRQDLGALFSLINQLITVMPDLVRGFNSIGLAIIGLTTRVIGVVGWFFSLNKGLSTFVAAGSGILSAWSVLAKFIRPLPGPIAVATSAFEALGVAGSLAFGGIGVAAAAFVVIANSLPDPVNKLVGSLAQQDKAVGDNAAGFTKLSGQLGEYLNHTKQLPSGVAPRALIGIAEAQLQASRTAAGLNENTKFLMDTYGLTVVQAQHVTTALGLGAGAFQGNSKAAQQARFEAQQYVATLVQAESPMSQFDFNMQQMTKDSGNLTKQTQDLADAYTALLSPLDTVLSDAGNLQVSLGQLTQAVKHDGSQVDIWTPKGADLGSKLATATTNATGLSDAIFHQTGNVKDAIRPLTVLVEKMQDLHIHGDLARQTVDKLVSSQAALYQKTGLNITQTARLIAKLDHIPLNKVIEILMHGTGNFSITGAPGHLLPHHRPTGHAAGGFIRGPGTATSDSIPARLSAGEYVVRASSVARYGPHMMDAINQQRFADGGFAGSVAGLGDFAQQQYGAFQNAMISAMESAMTAAAKAAMAAAAQTFGGGLGRAGLRYLENLWTSAGGPGGGTAHVAAAIALAESGGNPNARNPSGASGLWQILGQVVAGNIFNPVVNALNAVKKYRDAGGFSPWVTFTSGAYQQFMANGGVAAPGWAWVGERGPELVHMHGGETVVPNHALGGFAAGTSLSHLTVSSGHLWADIHKFLKAIADHFNGESQRRRDRLVERQADDMAEIRRDVHAAHANIAAARSFQQSTQSGLAGYADLSTTTLGAGAIMVGGKEKQLSGGQVIGQQLQGKLANLRKFNSILRRLAGMKLPSSLLQQVVALGPDAGVQYGQELLSGGPQLIKQLTATESQIARQERNISRGAASAAFGGGYHTGASAAATLRASIPGLEREFAHLGDVLGREAARWLGRGPHHGMAGGGAILEPIFGVGRSGRRYSFGERGPELVTPSGSTVGGRGPLVQVTGPVNIKDETDLAMVAQRLSFAVTAAGLGS